jgi:acyl-CoA thioester hydrolase
MIVSETLVRVRYADTDQMKFVYYAKFFEYFEQGRSDFLRGIGLPYPELERMGFFLPVIEASARYHKPAYYDDELLVRTMMKDVPQARVRIEYEVRNTGTKETLTEGSTVHSFLNAATGKPTRAPDLFLEILHQAFHQHKG